MIGAGPGGYAAAFYAADRGMQVTLIDPSPNPGGVCLYRGCIPSKALLHVAEVINEAKHAEAWGISFKTLSIDLPKVRAFKDKVVAQLTGGLGQLSKQRKVTFIRGTASFRDARSVEIAVEGEGQPANRVLQFEHAVVATGSRPFVPPRSPLTSLRARLQRLSLPRRLPADAPSPRSAVLTAARSSLARRRSRDARRSARCAGPT